ncbi:MAG: hypothetical protein IPL79_17715 [Myxococcales bacterium]|nr:hypothetical protein [Myxococcales bacterium]
MGYAHFVARGVAGVACMLAAFATACIRVPPPAAGFVAASAEDHVPEPGAPVVVVGVGPGDAADAGPYLGQACVVVSIEANQEAQGFVRALLACGAEQVLFTAVKLREVTKLATQRRLPLGLEVKIAGIGEGDVYFADRERFIGNRCEVVSLRRSQALYYQGTLTCFGVPYQFAYVAVAASP